MQQRTNEERHPASVDPAPHGPITDIVPVTIDRPNVDGEWQANSSFYSAWNEEASNTATATWTATLNAGKGTQLAVAAFLPKVGNSGQNTASATYTIDTDGGPQSVTKSQKARGWVSLGTFSFGRGSYGVNLTNATGELDGTTVVLAAKMRWGYTGDPEPDDSEEP